MLRKDRLAFCTECTKRGFDRSKGVVCGLTGEHATFSISCDFYEPDVDLIRRTRERNIKLEEKSLKRETFGLSQFGLKNLIIVGGIIVLLSIVWVVIGLYHDLIFFYPIIMLVIGIITIVKGVNRQTKQPTHHDILDDSTASIE